MIENAPQLHHVSTAVASLERTALFYQSLFGFAVVLQRPSVGGPAVVHLRQPNSPFVIELTEAPALARGVDTMHLGFSARSIPDLQTRILSISADTWTSRQRVGCENILLFRDPDGLLIEVNDGLV